MRLKTKHLPNIKIVHSVSSFTFLLIVVLLTGCIKEKYDPANFDATLSLTPGLAIPIGFSHLGFEKYIEESSLNNELRVSEDGFLSFYYSTEIDSGVMGDILSIDDAIVSKSILNQTGIPIILNIPGSTLDLADSIIIPITNTQADARIDSIKLGSGTLQINITPSNLSGTISIELNGLMQNGSSFSTTTNLANPNISISLANYTLIPEHDVSDNNQLKCSLTLRLQSPSGPINPGELLTGISAELINIDYETIYGDFEGYSIDIPDQTIETPFFQDLSDGSLVFADPRIKLFFSNSVGVPIGISFSTIDAIDRDLIHHPLSGSGIPLPSNPKIISYPSLSQIGQTISDSLIIDKNNSNLPDFIASFPDSIRVSASALIAPAIAPGGSFISKDSKYNISAVIELPLWGKAGFLILLDTMTFDYLSSAIPPPDEIEKLIIRTSIVNSFPVTAYPQIFLLDENYALLDSLFTGLEKIEGSSETDGDGKSTPQKQAPIDIDLPRSKIDNLLNTRYLALNVRLSTTEFPTQDVKFYSSYFLDFNVGVIAQLKIKTGK